MFLEEIGRICCKFVRTISISGENPEIEWKNVPISLQRSSAGTGKQDSCRVTDPLED